MGMARLRSQIVIYGLGLRAKKGRGTDTLEAERRCNRQINALGPTRPSSGRKMKVVLREGYKQGLFEVGTGPFREEISP
jgi:hypothetical protein